MLKAAGQLPGTLWPWTFQALFGLLACTWLRISEALRLRVPDVDFSQGLIVVRESKFGQTRLVPLHPTAQRALRAYARKREHFFPLAGYFFTSDRGRRLNYCKVRNTFAQLREPIAGNRKKPRIHDLRHTFTCRVLQRWQGRVKGAQSRVIILSRYLGHADINSTYWYLHALPELMAEAGKRFELFQDEGS
jgi:integrase